MQENLERRVRVTRHRRVVQSSCSGALRKSLRPGEVDLRRVEGLDWGFALTIRRRGCGDGGPRWDV